MPKNCYLTFPGCHSHGKNVTYYITHYIYTVADLASMVLYMPRALLPTQ
jgi:hypothetical protein